MKTESSSIPASLLRQYCFCPRIPFFTYVRQLHPPRAPWVEAGVAMHQRIEQLLKRRDLTKLTSGRSYRLKTEVPLYSPDAPFHGICDAVLELEDGTYIPLEIKSPSILRMRPFMASATLYWNLKTVRTFRWRSSPETLPRTRARSFSFVHTPFCLNNCMAAGSISASFFTRPNPSTRKFSSPMPFGENSTSALKQSSVTQPKHLYRRLRPRTLNARSVNS